MKYKVPRILLSVNGGVVEVICTTIDIEVAIVDEDTQESNTYTHGASLTKEFLSKLEELKIKICQENKNR